MSSTHRHHLPPHHQPCPEQQQQHMVQQLHPHPPPPVVPLEQLPSASIAQLPPSHHVPKANPAHIHSAPFYSAPVATSSATSVSTAEALHMSDPTNVSYTFPAFYDSSPVPKNSELSYTFENQRKRPFSSSGIPSNITFQSTSVSDDNSMTMLNSSLSMLPEPSSFTSTDMYQNNNNNNNSISSINNSNNHAITLMNSDNNSLHINNNSLHINNNINNNNYNNNYNNSTANLQSIRYNNADNTSTTKHSSNIINNNCSADTNSNTNHLSNATSKVSDNMNNNNYTHLSDKKLRRLEKNRLSARECRRRKREATEDMEQEIIRLEAENLKLRLQLRIGEEAEESIHREQERVTEEIEHLLKSGASEGEIYATIEEFKEKFADYGRDRRSAIEFHLQNVERLLQPTQTTSVAMRALEGGTKFMESACISPTGNAPPIMTSRDGSTRTSEPKTASASNLSLREPKTLFTYLAQYLEVTPEQAAALKDSRWVARELDECLHSSLDVLEQLRQRLRLCGNGLETEFDNVRSILTPTQAAKFLVWVANNRACIHMLNELWSRVYPDPSAVDEEDEEAKPDSKEATP